MNLQPIKMRLIPNNPFAARPIMEFDNEAPPFNVTFTNPCRECGEVLTLEFPAMEVDAFFQQQLHVQEAFPNTTPDEREHMFLSGLCGKCYDHAFRDPELQDIADEFKGDNL